MVPSCAFSVTPLLSLLLVLLIFVILIYLLLLLVVVVVLSCSLLLLLSLLLLVVVIVLLSLSLFLLRPLPRHFDDCKEEGRARPRRSYHYISMLNSFQTTPTPNPKKLSKYCDATKQEETCF